MMDEDGLNDRSWGHYEPFHFRGNLGFQPIPSIIDRNCKLFLPGQNPNVSYGYGGAFITSDCFVSDATISMDCNRLNQHRDPKFFSMLSADPSNYSVVPETYMAEPMQLLQPPSREVAETDEPVVKNEAVESKKRQRDAGLRAPKAKNGRKRKDEGSPRVRRERGPPKKCVEVVINGVTMDISGLPIPVCSCTGTPQACYRWGCGGWQSACCTTNMSMYPLPMSTKRRGARIAGRKMSQGAFTKVLEKLAAEGYDFATPINLKSRWARHGTNKFVTIR